MFHNDTIAGSWTGLLDRLARRDGLARWATADPRLAGMSDVERDLLPALLPAANPAAFDDILAALVHRAARDGGDDLDAVSLMLHLSSDWVLSMARELADLAPDIVAVLVSELTCRIGKYPWRTRRGAVAVNLRMDTRHAVLHEYRPSVRNYPELREIALEPSSDGWERTPLGAPIPGPDESGEIDVLDLLMWAARTGMAEDDLRLLVRTECARADVDLVAADRVVAAEFGVARATFHRRRGRALADLRSAARSYLAAVA